MWWRRTRDIYGYYCILDVLLLTKVSIYLGPQKESGREKPDFRALHKLWTLSHIFTISYIALFPHVAYLTRYIRVFTLVHILSKGNLRRQALTSFMRE